MTSKSQRGEDVIKNLSQFVNASTHNISLTSFIVIWLEIAKLGGEGPYCPLPPSVINDLALQIT